MKLKKNKKEKGITLIALVVSVVILIILATITIKTVIGDDGILTEAKKDREQLDRNISKTEQEMQDLDDEMTKYEETTGGVTVRIGGNIETLTKANVAIFLGKVVTNYMPTTRSVEIGGTEYSVSTDYRLYYVDFDGKYGEKNGVYLKADCTSDNVALGQDTTSDKASNVKIRALNPSLYKTGLTAPSASNNNMKAVTWLTNTSNWDSLKTGASLANKVNYVVGAPSVEMMMDSYNTKYNLTESTPNIETLSESTERVKLFYQYPTTLNSNNYGYEVGPSNSSSAKNGYYNYTSNYSVKTDSAIDSMYYPGDSQYYWLASPSVSSDRGVLSVSYKRRGLCVHQHL